jgi:Phosphotransferase enzyme family
VTRRSHVAIINERGQCLARRTGAGLELPEVNIAHDRAGIAIFRAIRDQLNLRVFCLVCPGFDQVPLLRLQSPSPPIPKDVVWAEPMDVPSAAELPIHGIRASADDFGGFDWYSRVSVWLEDQINRLGYAIEGLEQWNGRIGGVLLRVVTDGPDFWFKAVSHFNTREFRIAQMLAEKHPRYFPRVVAAEPSWNALLLEHISGIELHERDNLDEWKAATAALADVQMDWMGSERGLLLAGAADLRAETIASGLPAFLDHLEAAMARQPKMPPPRLTRADLEQLRPSLRRLTDRAGALALGPGLANADFSPHNMLWAGTGPRFIDWAEACVSLPLIAGEYLWNRMAIECPDRASWQSSLRDVYLRRWAEQYGMDAIQRAAEILPTFAVLAVAMFFHERECNGPSVYDAYIRSLARRLQKDIKEVGSGASVSVFAGSFAEFST